MKVTTTREFGLMLAERRRQLGMTQQEFADHVGVPRLWVAQVETGRTNPGLSRLLDVVRRAGLSLNLVGPSGDGDQASPVHGRSSPARVRPNLDDHLARFTDDPRRSSS